MRAAPGRFVMFLAIGFFCLTGAAASEKVLITKQQMENLGIRLITLQQADTVPLARVPAQVTIPPDQEYLVSAPQSGLVSKVLAALGDRVTEGQLLAQITSHDLIELQLRLLNAHSQFRLAQAKFKRDKKLLEEGVISERRWLETESEYHARLASLNEERQTLLIAGMNEKAIDRLLATRRLKSTLDIRAPISGVILERMIVAGQRIDLLAPLYRVANVETLWLDMDMPQERLSEIRLGDRVLVGDTNVQAHVILIGQQVNPANQTVLVRAKIAGAPENFRPGQKTSAQLLQASASPLFKVPSSALVRNGEQSFIFVRESEGFIVRPVEVAGQEEQNVIIRNTFQSGEQIAVQGVAALKASWLGIGGE